MRRTRCFLDIEHREAFPVALVKLARSLNGICGYRAITVTVNDKRQTPLPSLAGATSQPLSFLVARGRTKSKKRRGNEGREGAQTKKETGHPSLRSVVVDEVGKHDLLPAGTYLPGWRRSHPARRQRERAQTRKVVA